MDDQLDFVVGPFTAEPLTDLHRILDIFDHQSPSEAVAARFRLNDKYEAGLSLAMAPRIRGWRYLMFEQDPNYGGWLFTMVRLDPQTGTFTPLGAQISPRRNRMFSEEQLYGMVFGELIKYG